MKRILEKEGQEVELYEDAAPALEGADFGSSDLVLIDLQMPTSGYDAIEEIRNRGFNELPLIVISAHVDLVLTAEMLDVQDIIHKPFDIAEFSKSVHKFI